MATIKAELLVKGYIRKYFTSRNEELPPDDIISVVSLFHCLKPEWYSNMEDRQAFELQKIIDTLISAGYHRAQCKFGLDMYDLVLGGISWLIIESGIPVRVQFTLKESRTIADRGLIFITILHFHHYILCCCIHSLKADQIYQALMEMKCPFTYWTPIHITGLMCAPGPALKIIQWLVKLMIEYRRFKGDTRRNYANFLFDSSIGYKDHYLKRRCKKSGREFLINSVSDRYRLYRKFLKQNDFKFHLQENLVDATLLEYGYSFAPDIDFEPDIDEDNEDNEDNLDAVERRQKLDMSKYGGVISKLNGSRM